MSKAGKPDTVHDPLAWIAQGRKEAAPKAPKPAPKAPSGKAKGKGKPTPGR